MASARGPARRAAVAVLVIGGMLAPAGGLDLSAVIRAARARYGCAMDGHMSGSSVAMRSAFPNAADDWVSSRFLMLMEACPAGSGWNTTAIERTDRRGEPLVAMTANVCGEYLAAGAAVGSGLIVEFGTWAGASMRCMAAGVNLTQQVGVAIGFDAFELGYVASNAPKLQGMNARWWARATAQGKDLRRFDIEPLFRWQTEDVYPSVRAVRGNFRDGKVVRGALGTGGRVVDVFSTDAAKSDFQLLQDLANVADYLKPGSLVILADFFQMCSSSFPPYWQRRWVLARLVPRYLHLLGFHGEHAFFGVATALSSAHIRRLHLGWRKARSLATTRCQAATHYAAALADVCGGSGPGAGAQEQAAAQRPGARGGASTRRALQRAHADAACEPPCWREDRTARAAGPDCPLVGS